MNGASSDSASQTGVGRDRTPPDINSTGRPRATTSLAATIASTSPTIIRSGPHANDDVVNVGGLGGGWIFPPISEYSTAPSVYSSESPSLSRRFSESLAGNPPLSPSPTGGADSLRSKTGSISRTGLSRAGSNATTNSTGKNSALAGRFGSLKWRKASS